MLKLFVMFSFPFACCFCSHRYIFTFLQGRGTSPTPYLSPFSSRLRTNNGRVDKANMKLKLTNCDFFQPQIYLGHLLSEKGISHLQRKIRCNKSHATPQNIRTQTVLRTYRILQQPHQSLCQHYSYTYMTTEKGCSLAMDRTTSRTLQRM